MLEFYQHCYSYIQIGGVTLKKETTWETQS